MLAMPRWVAIGGVAAVLAACGRPAPDSQGATEAPPYPHATEPIGTARQVYDGVLPESLAVNTFRNTDRLFATRRIAPSANPVPLEPATSPLTDVRFMAGAVQHDLASYLELNGVAALLVLHEGRVALEQYRFGNTPHTRWMSMSIAKSVTSTLVGAALHQGAIASLDDLVTRYLPALEGTGYAGVTVRQLLTMTSGVGWDETYTDPASDRRRLLEAQIAQAPGAALAVMAARPRAADPGTVHTYNTGETQVVAELLRQAVGQPLSTYLAERVWERVGMEAPATWWLDSPGGVEIGGSGFAATLRDYGRFGQFLLEGGRAGGEAILPDGWVAEATSPKQLADGTEVEYGYLWWTGTTPGARRDGVFVAEGLYGQFIYVNPAARAVIVVWSARAQPTGSDVVDDWAFFEAVADSLRR